MWLIMLSLVILFYKAFKGCVTLFRQPCVSGINTKQRELSLQMSSQNLFFLYCIDAKIDARKSKIAIISLTLNY